MSVGKELGDRKRRYPEAWQMGEYRFEIIPNEDRHWTAGMVDAFMQEAGADAVRLVAAGLKAEGGGMPIEALSTIGIACGYTLEPVMQQYISSGTATQNRTADPGLPQGL